MDPFWFQNGVLQNSGFILRIFKILQNERGQYEDENDINDFSSKILVCRKRPFVDPQMDHPHNSGSTLRNFEKSCTLKKANK